MSDEQDRLISGGELHGDFDASIRPATLSEFIGQRKACDNLKVFIEAAKARGKALDHVLFLDLRGLEKRHLPKLWRVN